MFTSKNVYIFLAGAFFFHAISHFLLPYYVDLPLQIGTMTITSELNAFIAVISLIMSIGLLFAAKRSGE